MNRVAFVSGSTLGALEAYDRIITDLSSALCVKDTAVRTLFFGGMILSGIDQILAPSDSQERISAEFLGFTRFQKDESFKDVWSEVRNLVWSHALIEKEAGDHGSVSINEFVAFLSEVVTASKYNKPLITTFPIPEYKILSKYLGRELHDLVKYLEQSFKYVENPSPLLSSVINKDNLSQVQSVLDSKVFSDYGNSMELAKQNQMSTHSIQEIGSRARKVTEKFDDLLSLRNVSSRVFGLVPDVIEVFFGKLSGKFSRIITDPISELIQGNSSIQVYSFYPIWREVWETRLDNVREVVRMKKEAEMELRELKQRQDVYLHPKLPQDLHRKLPHPESLIMAHI